MTCRADDRPLVRTDRCEQCELDLQLRALVTDPPAPTAGELFDALRTVLEPRRLAGLIERNVSVRVVLREIAGGQPLTHATLDARRSNQSVELLRDLLVDAELLAERNRQLAQFDQWCARVLDEITPAADRRIVIAYATWHHRRRLAQHARNGSLKPWATRVARQQIRVAIALLDWLRAQATSLADCDQAHLDRWFAAGPTTRRHSVHFLHWATEHHHCRGLAIPTVHVALPTPMPHTERVELVARLITDHTLALPDRVAGLLTVVCAQPVPRICSLRLDAVTVDGDTTAITVGTEQIPLTEPVAQLVHQLAGQRTSSVWLFPGRVPGHHMSASTLNQRLRAIGVTRAARIAALHDLIGQVPTPILADALGYNPNFIAERAANLSTGWNTYAALPR